LANKDIERLKDAVDEYVSLQDELRRKILSEYSKEIFGYPPSFKKRKQGKPVNHKVLTEIYLRLY
jgi:hypothetical protein